MSLTTEPRLPPCPTLPDPPHSMDWRALNEFRREGGAELYLRCLTYGNYLWIRRLAARAILAVDRGLLTEVEATHPVLTRFPLPYRAIGWMVREVPRNLFVGNPRVHYQHLADRVRGERAEQRRWRAWACWHIVRLSRPELPGDSRHEVVEPTAETIRAQLDHHGIAGETAWWLTACEEAVAAIKTRAPAL